MCVCFLPFEKVKAKRMKDREKQHLKEKRKQNHKVKNVMKKMEELQEEETDEEAQAEEETDDHHQNGQNYCASFFWSLVHQLGNISPLAAQRTERISNGEYMSLQSLSYTSEFMESDSSCCSVKQSQPAHASHSSEKKYQ